MERAEKRAWDGRAHDLHFERPIASRLETVTGIVVGGEDGHFVAELLEGEGGVDDELFCSTDAKVGVDEADTELLARGMDRVGYRCGLTIERHLGGRCRRG